MATVPLPGTKTRYLSKKADDGDTFCFDFSDEAVLDAGGTLTSPDVTADPTGTLVVGSPVVLAADFTDTDGTIVPEDKGVKVRIQPGTATPGTKYLLTCVVTLDGNEKVRHGWVMVTS